MSGKTICFRSADWIIGWDERNSKHCYFRNADLAYRDGTIIHVGPGKFEGHCDEEIPGAGLCLMPGLVDIHNHSASMPTFRGIREELGNPNFFFSGLYEGWGLFMPPIDRRAQTTRLAICELLLSGVTTYVDMSYPYPGWIDAVAETGIRASLSPLFDSAKIVVISDHQLEYRWAPDGGTADYKNALALLDQIAAHPSGLLSPMVSPMSVDACTPELLRQSYELALDRGWPYHLHAGMSVIEFHEMTRRTGLTPIQWLEKLGVLGPATIIGHSAILDHHSWIHWHTREDIGILARSGASISHCPVVLSRVGVTLESFGAYRKAGINVGIGTDCHPHNMLEEMREAAILSRVTDQHMFSARTADVFDAATTGGARALLRDDIGRLEVGGKADIVAIDVTHPMMLPLYDPLRSLLFSACDRAVKDVYIAGKKVVADGKVLTVDHQAIADEVALIQADVTADIPNRDRKRRTALEVAPLTYETISSAG
ncbi:amidohydrolase family protein [Mesorhizobium sp. 1B3]|uniref:amidohydrolase family protein n=1 Tax=Mesorhizobium sp. 1B3 TaxID=3243599 RepID=UPI003D95192C